VHEKIATLKTTDILDSTFLERGDAGLVWLTRDGRTIAKQLASQDTPDKPEPQPEADAPPPPFVSACRCDVFVSYALPEGEAGQWQVRQTVETLRQKITNNFQARGQTLVWGESAECGPELLPNVQQSAVRILIVSERYREQIASLDNPAALFAPSQGLRQGRQTVLLELEEAAQSFGDSAQTVRYALWDVSMTAFHNLLSDISMQICDMLQDLHEKAKVLAHTGGVSGKNVFLDHDMADALLAENLSERIDAELHPIIFFPDYAASSPSERIEWFKNNVLLCDGLLVLYGEAQRTWVLSKILTINKLLAQREEPIDAYAVYLGPPEKAADLPVKGITQIDCRRCPDGTAECRDSACEGQLLEHFIAVLR
jgi:hypothetical protein